MTEKREGLTMNQLAENNALLTTENRKLQEQVKALAAEHSLLLLAIPALKEVHFDSESFDDVSIAEEIGFNEAIALTNKNIADTQTPATDAVIREIGAKAVEGLANTFNSETIEGVSMKGVARRFAAKLLAGEQP